MKDLLILVDENDVEIGAMDKLSTHQKGRLHRAFSIFIFNSNGELLLQQRANEKYHSGGLWTNTCCSHPHKGELTSDAIHRRLQEEMGMQCNMDFKFNFIYKHQFVNGLTENEYDHVYFGTTDKMPIPNPHEVQNWKYMTISKLQDDVDKHPELYTVWLKISLPKIVEHLKTK